MSRSNYNSPAFFEGEDCGEIGECLVRYKLQGESRFLLPIPPPRVPFLNNPKAALYLWASGRMDIPAWPKVAGLAIGIQVRGTLFMFVKSTGDPHEPRYDCASKIIGEAERRIARQLGEQSHKLQDGHRVDLRLAKQVNDPAHGRIAVAVANVCDAGGKIGDLAEHELAVVAEAEGLPAKATAKMEEFATGWHVGANAYSWTGSGSNAPSWHDLGYVLGYRIGLASRAEIGQVFDSACQFAPTTSDDAKGAEVEGGLEVPTGHEGTPSVVLSNRYERDPKLRELCLKLKGRVCFACGFDPTKEYRHERASKVIEVHHIFELATFRREHKVDPSKDLVPLCPNCHRMAHKTRPAMNVEKLKELIGIPKDIKN